MANIAVTNYCNLKCPYCFADDMICEEKRHITLEQFRATLDWLARTPKNHIGIIGGEPTLHPQFGEILHEVNLYCRDLRTSATLFTNGIYLNKYLPEIGEGIGVLINCNHPDGMTAEQEKQFRATMEHLDILGWFRERATCGCNLYVGLEDYGYIWELVDRYQLNRLRYSVTAPGGQYTQWRHDKEGYYTAMKPILLRFCGEAEKRGVLLCPDCNHIPDCYLTQEERELVARVNDHDTTGFCEPVVDITPDFRATACFGSYDPVDCGKFRDLIELERYLLLKKSYPRVCANATGKCAGCPEHECLRCQGGCLGFAEV